MTATGSVISNEVGLVGVPQLVRGRFTFSNAAANGEVYTITNLFPRPVKILDVELIGSVMDTNASPTLAVKIGNTDDDDGFMAATVLSQTVQTNRKGLGDLVGAIVGDDTASKDVVLTVTANPGTGASSGAWDVLFWVAPVNY